MMRGDRLRRLLRASPSSLVVSLLILAAWGLQRWGGGLVPVDWSLALNGERCRLVRVIDGDSARLDCQGRRVEVRLYCIDAPEKGQPPWGERARDHLRSIAPRELLLRPIDQDRYGRTVGELYTTDTPRRLLNLEQVENGQAAVYGHYCKDARYDRAERAARAARRGIWSRRGLHQTPWIFRHRQARYAR